MSASDPKEKKMNANVTVISIRPKKERTVSVV